MMEVFYFYGFVNELRYIYFFRIVFCKIINKIKLSYEIIFLQIQNKVVEVCEIKN